MRCAPLCVASIRIVSPTLPYPVEILRSLVRFNISWYRSTVTLIQFLLLRRPMASEF
jgi:hypothetical protein